MSSPHRRRNIIIGILVIIILILAVLIIRGIVEKRRDAARDRIDDALERASGSGGSQSSQSGSSGGQTSSQASDEEPAGQLAPAQEPPEEGNGGIVPVENSPGFVEIVDQLVTSYRGPPGGQRVFQASVKGDATQVTMSITGPGGAFTVSLIKGPLIDGQTNWAVEHAGPSMPGTYSYSTTAVASDGHSVTEQGAEFIVDEQ
jgi:hypothetical protein